MSPENHSRLQNKAKPYPILHHTTSAAKIFEVVENKPVLGITFLLEHFCNLMTFSKYYFKLGY
jgi:hypothetical protein